MPPEAAVAYALAADWPAAENVPSQPDAPVVVIQSMGLTRRELEVAALIAQGLTNRLIAAQLVVSEWTIDSHVRHILTKLGFRSRAQVATWAVEQEILPPDPA